MSTDGNELTFVDADKSHCYRKIREYCPVCQAELMFFTKNMRVEHSITEINCDKCKSPNKKIYESDFYFSCIECNKYEICNVCILKKYKRLEQDLSGIEEVDEYEHKELSIDTANASQQISEETAQILYQKNQKIAALEKTILELEWIKQNMFC